MANMLHAGKAQAIQYLTHSSACLLIHPVSHTPFRVSFNTVQYLTHPSACLLIQSTLTCCRHASRRRGAGISNTQFNRAHSLAGGTQLEETHSQRDTQLEEIHSQKSIQLERHTAKADTQLESKVSNYLI
jgi:hypothetical protein